MSVLDQVTTGLSLWMGSVAATLHGLAARVRRIGRIEVSEDEDGGFTMRAAQGPKRVAASLAPYRVQVSDGAVTVALPPEWVAAFHRSHVELALRPSRFLFRPVDLPKRAAEFVDGIVKSQIDRLTPWTAGDAVYHWTRPRDLDGDRIAITIAAAPRAGVAPLAEAFARLGAAAVEVTTLMPGTEASRLVVHSHRAGGAAEFARTRTVLLAVFAVTAALAISVVVAAGFVGSHLDDQKQQIQHQITQRRAALRAGPGGGGTSAVELLSRRKQTTASSVIVLEALSSMLPDDTYATELRIDGDKVQIVGVTRDAPVLIRLMEHSPHFTRATFFAPTTRAPNDPGERFHIEARIRPHFEPRS